ncbi:MAG TPA: HAD family hydrolase [Euryarchaeota archaeon]|nr:HAD family hydrolase [Euryarchaeota archaeon]
MARVRVITLDLWGTLIREVPERLKNMRQDRLLGMQEELESLGYRFGFDEIERAYRLSGDFCEQIWSRNQDMPVDDHLLFMLSCLESSLPSRLGSEGLEKIRTVYSDALLSHPPKLFDDVIPGLTSLKKSGFKLALISNTGRTPGSVLRRLLEEQRIDRYFDFMTFSNEVMVRKPDRRIFRYTLSNMHVTPRLTAHVGDDSETDFEGARAAGMIAIMIDRDGSAASRPDTIGSLTEISEIFS